MRLQEIIENLKNKRCGITEYNTTPIPSLICEPFLHQACILKEIKNDEYILLSYGRNIYTKTKTLHAEDHAIQNLIPSGKKKRKTKIILLVIRITRSKQNLCMSKPCQHCINCINNKPQHKGYLITQVLYSNEKGHIEKTKLIDLKSDHLSRYYKNQIKLNV
jgi:cytidine deaminase